MEMDELFGSSLGEALLSYGACHIWRHEYEPLCPMALSQAAGPEGCTVGEVFQEPLGSIVSLVLYI